MTSWGLKVCVGLRQEVGRPFQVGGGVCVCVYVGDKVRDINIDRMIEILCHVQ